MGKFTANKCYSLEHTYTDEQTNRHTGIQTGELKPHLTSTHHRPTAGVLMSKHWVNAKVGKRQRRKVEGHALLTKHGVKMAGYWSSYFAALLWTETKSRSIKRHLQKRMGPISSHRDRKSLVNRGFNTWRDQIWKFKAGEIGPSCPLGQQFTTQDSIHVSRSQN